MLLRSQQASATCAPRYPIAFLKQVAAWGTQPAAYGATVPNHVVQRNAQQTGCGNTRKTRWGQETPSDTLKSNTPQTDRTALNSQGEFPRGFSKRSGRLCPAEQHRAGMWTLATCGMTQYAASCVYTKAPLRTRAGNLLLTAHKRADRLLKTLSAARRRATPCPARAAGTAHAAACHPW